MEDSFVNSPVSVKAKPALGVGRGCLLPLLIAFVLVVTPVLWRRSISWYYSRELHTTVSAPTKDVALVFGAAVYRNGRLSPVLRDRMETAITLYNSGKVEKILVSGDNQHDSYDEPGAMMAYAVQRGVPEEDIQADYGGLRTYDTCYRARDIFQLENALLVTQAFHLPRAVFTCRRLGLDAVGVSADLRPYRGMRWYEFRETVATTVAAWDVFRRVPPPIMGEPMPLE